MTVPPARPRLRPLLLPVEHGGWGFLCEPIVLALVAAPGAAALWLSAAALAAFLARQPLKVALDDRRYGRRLPRTTLARAIAGGYMAVAVAALGVAAAGARQPFWGLGAAVVPLALVTLWHDSRGESRRLLPELAGAAALGAVAAAMAAAGGWPWPLALALWVTALVRVLPAIVTVRERVLRLHGQAPRRRAAAAAHGLALGAALALAAARLAPPLVAVVAAALAARAAWHLRPGAPPAPAMRIGVRELVTGLAAAAALGLAWARW